MFPSACPGWGFFSIVSSYLPAWYIQSLFLMQPVDRWIIAPWLVQQSSWHPCRQPMCSTACKAAQQPGTAAGTCVLQKQGLKSEIQELALKKLTVVSAALPSKFPFGVIKRQDWRQWHILVACGPCTEGCAVQREALPWPVLGQECSLAERHTVLAQGVLCLIPCLTAQLCCGTLPVKAHSRQMPAAVSFEVRAGGTVEEKQVSCSPLCSCVPAEAGKCLTLNASLRGHGTAPWPLVPGSSLKSACVKTPVIPEVGNALAPH